MSLTPGLPTPAESRVGAPISLSELRPVLTWMQARTGLVFPRARRTHALRALRKLVREHRVAPSQLVARARQEPALLDALCNALTVSESYFFRIPEHFEAIATRVLGALPPGSTLRCWSAGCSEGQEIYSLAMLLDEHGQLGRSELWATDLSPRVLDVARRGRYRPWALRGRACQPLRALLSDDSADFKVAEHVRRAVHFAQDNLASETPAPGPGSRGNFDLILCRHVLIYLDDEAVARVARRLFEALRPGGWLFCAPADPLLFEHAPFEVVPSPGGLIYRRPKQVPPPQECADPQPFDAATERAAPVIDHPPLAHGASLTGRTSTSAVPPQAEPVPASASACSEPSPFEEARAAFEARDWTSAVRVLEAPGLEPSPEVALLHLRALVNLDMERALRAAQYYEAMLAQHPHFHYLRARLAVAHRDDQAALDAVRRALYLQPGFLMALHLQALVWMQLANRERARATLTSLQQRCAARPGDQPVTLGEGRTIATLRAEVGAALHTLSSSGGDHVG